MSFKAFMTLESTERPQRQSDHFADVVLASYSNTCMNLAILNHYACKVEHNLEAAGRSPEIHVSIEMDWRFEMSYVPARIVYNRPRR